MGLAVKHNQTCTFESYVVGSRNIPEISHYRRYVLKRNLATRNFYNFFVDNDNLDIPVSSNRYKLQAPPIYLQ